MITVWTRHLRDEDAVAAFTKQIRNSVDVLDRLTEIIKEDLEQLEAVEDSVKSYDSPNWDNKQAHINGSRSYAKKLLKLLDQREHK